MLVTLAKRVCQWHRSKGCVSNIGRDGVWIVGHDEHVRNINQEGVSVVYIKRLCGHLPSAACDSSKCLRKARASSKDSLSRQQGWIMIMHRRWHESGWLQCMHEQAKRVDGEGEWWLQSMGGDVKGVSGNILSMWFLEVFKKGSGLVKRLPIQATRQRCNEGVDDGYVCINRQRGRMMITEHGWWRKMWVS